jgi:hypothetical protein
LAIVRSYHAKAAKKGDKKSGRRFLNNLYGPGMGGEGDESAEVILSVGGEGDGIFWSGGGAVFAGDDFGGESSVGFRGASGFCSV